MLTTFPNHSAGKKAGTITALLCRHISYTEHGEAYSTKRPIEGPAFLSRYGIHGQNEQEHYDDTENALLQYASEHYDHWRQTLPESIHLLRYPGAFSENIASLGMTELTICIGDIYRMGNACVQVSYGREACHTMNERFKKPDMAHEMHKLAFNGWFYRVLEEGYARAGDEIILLERPRPNWTIADIQACLFGYVMDKKTLETLSQLPELALVWRNLFARRLETGQVEENRY